MEKIVHEETNPWGISKTILIEGGAGKVCASMDNDFPRVVYISDLSVIPSRRRQGLGKILLREAMRAFIGEQDFDKYKLHANVNGIARDWYRREGFVETGETRFNGEEVEMVLPYEKKEEPDFERMFAGYIRAARITIQRDETLTIAGEPFNSSDLVSAARVFAGWAEDRLLAGASQSRIEELRHGVNTSVIKTYIPGAEVGDEVYIIPKKKRLAVVTPEDLVRGAGIKVKEGGDL